MAVPAKLWHFGKSEFLQDFIPNGQISFGLAADFFRSGLTKGQRDDEMKRTAMPTPDTTALLVGPIPEPIENLIAIKVELGIRIPYFMKCFSLGYSESMYSEIDGDMCVIIEDGPTFFERFKAALEGQLSDWLAFTAQYWDFARIPVGMTQRDLMFLKDSRQYSSQQEYRIVLVPPEGFVITSPAMRQVLELGSLADIAIVEIMGGGPKRS